jgi:hypothetical protein
MLVCEVGAEWFVIGSNLSQSARSGSEGIVISSPRSRPASDASRLENEQSGCAARFLVTETPSEAKVLGHKIQYGEGRHFCVRLFERKTS